MDKTASTLTDAAQARSEAHKACPIAGCTNYDEEFCCIVPETGCPYEWPGHAAIDRALAAARLDQAEKMCDIYDMAQGAGHARADQRAERDRLRRLAGGSNG